MANEDYLRYIQINQGNFLSAADATRQFIANTGVEPDLLASFFLTGAAAPPGQGNFFAPSNGFSINYGNINSIHTASTSGLAYPSIMNSNNNIMNSDFIRGFSWENSHVVMPNVKTDITLANAGKSDAAAKKDDGAECKFEKDANGKYTVSYKLNGKTVKAYEYHKAVGDIAFNKIQAELKEKNKA